MAVLDLPPTLEQVVQFQSRCLESVQSGDARQLKTVLPADALISLLRATETILRGEPTLVELDPTVHDPNAEVFVFGDTHGHFPDVAHIINELGYPSPARVFVFNGDYVDRGSWGVELLALLCCLKCAAPKHVYLLRGNHESSTCTKYYGYSQELRAKYEKQAKEVYAASKKLFSVMPLAALIASNTLVMHGGLFRKPPEPKRGAKRRKSVHPGRLGAKLEPGSLEHLRNATKGGMDPDGCGSSLLATDVLWSDPVAELGFAENDARGVGLTFGPDITEAFLRANNLRLIIRSHEGPDARDKRSDLPQVLRGYSFDHTTPAGQLVTVFSAPDYPQFQVVPDEGEDAGKRYDNLAAVAVLSVPDYATPSMRTFAAVRPRPKADAYYDYMACCDSDTDAPEGSEGGSGGGSAAASEVDPEGDEADGPSVERAAEMTEAKLVEPLEAAVGPANAAQRTVEMAEANALAAPEAAAESPGTAPVPAGVAPHAMGLLAAKPAEAFTRDTPPAGMASPQVPLAAEAQLAVAPAGGDAMEVEGQVDKVEHTADEAACGVTAPASWAGCNGKSIGDAAAGAPVSDAAGPLATPMDQQTAEVMAPEAEGRVPFVATAPVEKSDVAAVVTGSTIEAEAG